MVRWFVGVAAFGVAALSAGSVFGFGVASVASQAARTEPPADERELRQFDVGGATVLTRSASEQLPQQARAVRVDTAFTDAGDGFILCPGRGSLVFSDRCGGYVVDGLAPGGWTTTSNGVTAGDRSVIVSWPPVDGTVRRLSDGAHDPLDYQYQVEPEFPMECEAIDVLVPPDDLERFGAANPDRVAWLQATSRNPETGAVERGFLEVVREHLEDVRAELTRGEAEPCLVPVDFSRREMTAATDAVGRVDLGGGAPTSYWLKGIGTRSPRNRVTIELQVADRATVEQLVAVVDDPAILFIVGDSMIVSGT